MADAPKNRLEDRIEKTLVESGLGQTRVYEIRQLIEQYCQEAQTDPITQLPLRSQMERLFEPMLRRAREYGSPFSVLMLDLDNFKEVNDDHGTGYTAFDGKHYQGHDAGDALLKDIGEIIKKNMRTGDIIIRKGGDEILIGLPFTGIENEEEHISDRNNQEPKLEQTRFHFPNKAELVAYKLCWRIQKRTDHTASIGIAAYPITTREPDLSTLITQADQAAYSVKEDGKNGYAVYGRNAISHLK